jgi:predicted small lipoprotein YifL
MNQPLRFITALLLAMFLFGCGQSGPLYVPGDPSTIQPPPAPQDTDEEDEADDDSPATE